MNISISDKLHEITMDDAGLTIKRYFAVPWMAVWSTEEAFALLRDKKIVSVAKLDENNTLVIFDNSRPGCSAVVISNKDGAYESRYLSLEWEAYKELRHTIDNFLAEQEDQNNDFL